MTKINDTAVSRRAKRNREAALDVARKAEAAGCRLRRTINRNDGQGAEAAMRELVALAAAAEEWL